MKLERVREGVVGLTATVHEFAVLVGAARMTLDILRVESATASASSIAALEAVLNDVDRLQGGLSK